MSEIIYIGGYLNEINICDFSEGKLEIIQKVDNVKKPSYLHINNDVLYAVSESKEGYIYSFKIKDKCLEMMNFKSINESLPCHITTDIKRKNIVVSNYGSGSICIYEIRKNGEIGEKRHIAKYEKANMHFGKFVNNEIYAVDLGNNNIYIYNSKLKLKKEISLDGETGPRHLEISNDGKYIFILTELSNEILVYRKKRDIKLIQKISTIINNNKKTFAGAIKFSKDNKNLYVTNRGENTISVYSFDNNKLELIQNISCYGEYPRDITLNKSEEYVFIANQKSNDIVVLKRNTTNGMLSRMEINNLKIKQPSCIIGEKKDEI